MSKRGIPLSCLGPSALNQLKQAGVDVDKLISKERKKTRPSITAADVGWTTRANKFGVAPIEDRIEDGLVFDSKKERQVYIFLKERGIDFQFHKTYELQAAFEGPRGPVQAINYEADFVFVLPNKKEVLVDVKGVVTATFKLKQKMAWNKGLDLRCVKSLQDMAVLLHAEGLLKSQFQTPIR